MSSDHAAGAEFQTAPEMLKTLREFGVKSATFSDDDGSLISVEFFPSSPVVDPGEIAPKGLTMGGPAMCGCGHDETTHGQGGYCLRGCDIGKCGDTTNGK